MYIKGANGVACNLGDEEYAGVLRDSLDGVHGFFRAKGKMAKGERFSTVPRSILIDRRKPQALYPSAKLYSKFFKFRTPFYSLAFRLLPFAWHFLRHRLTQINTDYTDLFSITKGF